MAWVPRVLTAPSGDGGGRAGTEPLRSRFAAEPGALPRSEGCSRRAWLRSGAADCAAGAFGQGRAAGLRHRLPSVRCPGCRWGWEEEFGVARRGVGFVKRPGSHGVGEWLLVNYENSIRSGLLLLIVPLRKKVGIYRHCPVICCKLYSHA